MAAEQWVTLDWIEGGIGRLTIAREKALNALNPDVLAQLEERLDRLEASDQTRVVIVTGQGSRAFVAGADISFIHNLENEQAGSAFALRGQKLFQRFQQSRLLFIAASNGYCLGGG
jgi:enoyl-CoA hydratase